jgi:tRNA pseudouridine55 synthase
MANLPPPSTPFGFLPVDKPLGLSSHHIVAKVRRGGQIKQVGHAGTLDPLATGLLIVCVGAATRLSEYVMGGQKTYLATVRLGQTTTTYDAEGEITAEHNTDHLTEAHVVAAVAGFQGQMQQVPPMYSAIKQNGQKLYDLARRGQDVERPPRQVWLETTLLSCALPNLSLQVRCSAGTYIRSLAYDLGMALGVGGHLSSLRRTASGHFNQLLPWETLTAAFADGQWQNHLISEQAALADWPSLFLDSEAATRVRHGLRLPRGNHSGDVSLARAYAPDGRFLAVLTAEGDLWQPHKVFA